MKDMKKIFIVLSLLALTNLGFLSARQDLYASAVWSAKRNPRSFPAVQAAAITAQGATITGQVVDARTFQPLRGAVVSAASVPGTKPNAPANIGFRTGVDGKFILRGVAPGIVNFHVVKAGYTSGPFTSVRPAVDGERIDNVVLTVPPGASLSGRVVDEAGQPVAGMEVAVSSSSDPSAFVRAQSVRRATARTDDDGQYWLGGLPAGEFTIGVGGFSESARIVSIGSEPVVSSGAGEPAPAGLARVVLTIGEERTAADLVVQMRDTFTGAVPIDTSTGTIAGQVVDARGIGIPLATVVLRPTEKSTGSRTIRTDRSGRFQFQNVPPGSFSLAVVEQPTIAAGSEAARRTTLHIAAGTRTENVTLIGARGGTISGTLTDEFGDPVLGTVIAATPSGRSMSGDIVELVARQSGQLVSGRAGSADARGRYRITGLPPGEYLINAALDNAPTGRTEIHFEDRAGQERTLLWASVFYPGVPTVSQASKIVVGEGSESNGVDVRIEPIVTTASINVTATAGRPVNKVQLFQILLDDQVPLLERALTMTGSSVTVEARTGRYRLLATAEVSSDADHAPLWASADVTTDPLFHATVNLVLEPGAKISGRIVFEGTEPNRQSAGPSLLPMTVLPGMRVRGNSTLTTTTGEFSIDGVMPGRYVIQVGSGERGSSWMLKAAIVRGRDVLDEPIDLAASEEIDDVRLTVTDRITELSGRVSDASDRPIRDRWVVVFAADQKYWWLGSRRVRAVLPDQNGRYVIRALPAGTYIVTLVPDPIPIDGLTAANLPALVAAGLRVTLAGGDKKEQDLRSDRR